MARGPLRHVLSPERNPTVTAGGSSIVEAQRLLAGFARFAVSTVVVGAGHARPPTSRG